VRAAPTPELALQSALAHPPALLLLDIRMPGMDGFEVCRRLKLDPTTRDIPVIFVTAHSDEAAETRGLDAGAVDFITKPINPKIVRARVRTQLTLKAQSDLLRHWVYIDGLTGVPNRRYFDERLAAEWGRAVRVGAALSVVLIDVDFFKRYNDRFGHQVGDDCLRQVAATLKAGLKRPGDLVARYGGEEFACLLPETPLDGAMELAQQLGQAVHDQGIPHPASDAAAVVTVSLGVCSKAEDTVAALAALVREADAQLYIAKSRGRHQSAGTELGDA
jgi:diguanylate cyclase (GGDEF)-like protein